MDKDQGATVTTKKPYARKRLSDYTQNELRERKTRIRDRHERRLVEAETFPTTGKVRAAQVAAYLGIGISTLWLYVRQGRVKEPQRYGARVSVWDAEYVRELYKGGIPSSVVEG